MIHLRIRNTTRHFSRFGKEFCQASWNARTTSTVNLVPYHPVTNPNKPEEVRRVANAISKFRGESLNSNLLTGPDLLNILDSVLLRFREHPVAVLLDIEWMFMQIAVRPEEQAALRFLWMIDSSIRQFQRNHITDNKMSEKWWLQVDKICFKRTRCTRWNIFRWQGRNKWDHKSPWSKMEHNRSLFCNVSSRTISKWCNSVHTKKNIQFGIFNLRSPWSAVSSDNYNQNGFGKLQIWRLGWRKWDDLIPQELHNALQKVLNSCFAMPEIRIPRSVHNFSNITSSQPHIFVDASMAAMAAVAYLCTTNSQISPPQACFLIGKCKAAPIKQINVPKMQLAAADIGMRLLQLIRREMILTFNQIFLWSDSHIELDWIASKKKQKFLFQTDCRKYRKFHRPSNGITSLLVKILPIVALAVLRLKTFNTNG